jgi:hypothetical protein
MASVPAEMKFAHGDSDASQPADFGDAVRFDLLRFVCGSD